MAWIQVHFQATHWSNEALGERLLGFGAQGLQVVDKADFIEAVGQADGLDFIADDYLDSLDQSVTLEAFFPARKADGAIEVELFQEEQFAPELYETSARTWRPLAEAEALWQRLAAEADGEAGETAYLRYDYFEDQDWQAVWEASYHALEISERLAIVPSWVTDFQPRPGQIVLHLDPGSAFGTGEHETTSLCLKALESYFADPAKRPLAFLDLGCGSGILAIAALKFGAEQVLAADLDAHAVAVAEENAAQNGVHLATRVGDLASLQDAQGAPLCFDCICANLIDRLHILQAALYAERVRPGGTLILSGIVLDRLDDVEAALAEVGFRLLERAIEGEWVCLTYEQPA